MFCTDPFTHANFDAKFVALCFSVIFWRDFSPRYYTGFRLVQKFRAPQRRFKKPENTALELRPNWAESTASFAIFNTSFSATKTHENSAPWLMAPITLLFFF